MALLIAGAIVTLVLLPVTVNVATGGALAPLRSWTWPAIGVLLVAAIVLAVREWGRDDGISVRFPDHPKNRPNALDRVDKFVRERLENSLSEKVRIALSLNEQSTKVLRQSSLRVRAPDGPPREHFGSVHEAFEALDESMLVLGAPGSGKTTMLLELAVSLIDLARNDERRPVPVLVDLASWSRWKGSLSFTDWVLAEVEHQYHIPHRITKAWLNDGRLALLLDGLDEVEPADRDSCVQALNALQDKLLIPQLAVSSRERDYDRLATRLRMHGAVVIRPLSRFQVLDFLEFHEIDVDHELLEMLGSPLMLNIVMLGRQTGARIGLDRRKLFDAYVAEVLSSQRGQTNFPARDVLRWLKFLATYAEGPVRPVRYTVPDRPPRDVQVSVKRWLAPFARAGAVTIGTMMLTEWFGGWTGLLASAFAFVLSPLLGFRLLFGYSARFRPVPVTRPLGWAASGAILGVVLGSVGVVLGSVVAFLVSLLPPVLAGALFTLLTGVLVGGWRGFQWDIFKWSWATVRWGASAGVITGGMVALWGTPRELFVGWGVGLGLGLALSLVRDFDVLGDDPSDKMIDQREQRSAFSWNLQALIIGTLIGTAAGTVLSREPAAAAWPALIGCGIGLLYGHIARWIWPTNRIPRPPVVRVAIAVCGHVPVRPRQFLQYAADRSLLIEAAGEFRFVHALVQEHLAKCDPEKLAAQVRVLDKSPQTTD
ncbi:NACHT domain-containing protein [Lentzea flaviverrucosa]|uniref:NACHT domain-containing protein n=1 Tax=Lentzea flaviverrucosa TaxID=200379 RepID=A0A1H9XSX3_9PSEU|nr:NACHT domain-containing protein [Lentzea flaviverrucosa]SES49149.1 NACHT domain-containing protein [Lentzea flaviverrucosa]